MVNVSLFPKHFEVRFTEHTLNLLNAVLHDLDAARSVWPDMSEGNIASDRKEKQMASLENGLRVMAGKWQGQILLCAVLRA